MILSGLGKIVNNKTQLLKPRRENDLSAAAASECASSQVNRPRNGREPRHQALIEVQPLFCLVNAWADQIVTKSMPLPICGSQD
jgi:hypothetical protein